MDDLAKSCLDSILHSSSYVSMTNFWNCCSPRRRVSMPPKAGLQTSAVSRVPRTSMSLRCDVVESVHQILAESFYSPEFLQCIIGADHIPRPRISISVLQRVNRVHRLPPYEKYPPFSQLNQRLHEGLCHPLRTWNIQLATEVRPIAPVDVRWYNNVLSGIAMGPF